jgi:hypothetical protein
MEVEPGAVAPSSSGEPARIDPGARSTGAPRCSRLTLRVDLANALRTRSRDALAA